MRFDSKSPIKFVYAFECVYGFFHICMLLIVIREPPIVPTSLWIAGGMVPGNLYTDDARQYSETCL